MNKTAAFFKAIPKEKLNFSYAPDKWTIKEVLQHIIDTERIFAYRALRFARNDQTSLPGFEVEDYIPPAKVYERPLEKMIREYTSLRIANIALFESFDDDMLQRSGIASDNKISVRVIGFKFIGHEIHHLRIIEERYL